MVQDRITLIVLFGFGKICVWKLTYHRAIKKKVVILVYLVKNYCVLKMSENKEEIRYILKFYYKKGNNATQAAKKNCDVYGHDAVSVRVAQSWFKRFQPGNFDIKDAPCSGRPITGKIGNHGKSWARPPH